MKLLLFTLMLSWLSCTDLSEKKADLSFVEEQPDDKANHIRKPFDIPELYVTPSPEGEIQFSFQLTVKVLDHDISPSGALVAIIVEEGEKHRISLWKMGESTMADEVALPSGIKAQSLTWHPRAHSIFVLGTQDNQHHIFRVAKENGKWNTRSVFSDKKPFKRLIACPRPFITNMDETGSYFSYRLFFGMDNGNGSFKIVSVTENGTKLYQVIGPETNSGPVDASIPNMNAEWALPVAFHPAGHQLLWQTRENKYMVANYSSSNWDGSSPMNAAIKDKVIIPSPNGLGYLLWQAKSPGLGIYLHATGKEEKQLEKYRFVTEPAITPDGKGVVGITSENGVYKLNYVPINFPLPDVLNAWMFAPSQEEINLLKKNSGLFRPDVHDQLYKLYETENYACDGYDRSSPTRPYMVTTDIFWELLGAAYQGLFIMKERDEAIPEFWKMAENGESALTAKGDTSAWKDVFTTLIDLKKNNTKNPEVLKILKEQDGHSQVSGENYLFSNLKPRGHYTSSAEMKMYFKAFRYFTTILSFNPELTSELNKLPKEVHEHASRWIKSYTGFIAPSRSRLVWENLEQVIPRYTQHPDPNPSIFPLSWGFDNEVLFSTIYHSKLPPELQIKGPGGPRLLPSGLDLASAMGSGFAENLLQADYVKYPPLKKVIDNLKSNYRKHAKNPDTRTNIYNNWINAVAIQWADSVKAPNAPLDNDIWKAKRLQTGLATWATLRHATVLVNERVAAECGESGFEEILMRAPRGYVEPDPYTFGAIAELFENMIGYIAESTNGKNDIYEYEADKRSLYDGLVVRLKEAAADARQFKEMAKKVKKGEALSNEENEKILYVARVAEHLLLVFNSISNPNYGLAEPEPMAKITDVAGDGTYLMASVGNCMEWDHVVPYYGRKQLVKGAVYSYYEFTSTQLLNDHDWRTRVTYQEAPFWIKPFITKKTCTGMAKTRY